MQDILVSMILPVYNGEKFIEKSIKSVLNQTYNNIEIIVINDGSTDKTHKVVSEIKEQDPRIKYYEIKNSGVSSARNIGLKKATGKYVGFIDADDYIDEAMIDTLVSTAEKHECDIVGCSYERNYPGYNIKEEVDLKSGYYDKKGLEKYIYPNLFGHKDTNNLLPLNIVTKIFKNSIIKEHGIMFAEDVKFGEDLLFTRNFLLHSDSFYFMGDLPLYKYVYNEKSATSDYYPNKWDEQIKSILARKKLVTDYPEYKLEEQYKYSVLYSSINGLLNIFKNEKLTKNSTIEELSYIVEDSYVRSAVDKLSFNILSPKDKILAYLIKWRKPGTIYYLLKFSKRLKG